MIKVNNSRRFNEYFDESTEFPSRNFRLSESIGKTNEEIFNDILRKFNIITKGLYHYFPDDISYEIERYLIKQGYRKLKGSRSDWNTGYGYSYFRKNKKGIIEVNVEEYRDGSQRTIVDRYPY